MLRASAGGGSESVFPDETEGVLQSRGTLLGEGGQYGQQEMSRFHSPPRRRFTRSFGLEHCISRRRAHAVHLGGKVEVGRRSGAGSVITVAAATLQSEPTRNPVLPPCDILVGQVRQEQIQTIDGPHPIDQGVDSPSVQKFRRVDVDRQVQVDLLPPHDLHGGSVFPSVQQRHDVREDEGSGIDPLQVPPRHLQYRRGTGGQHGDEPRSTLDVAGFVALPQECGVPLRSRQWIVRRQRGQGEMTELRARSDRDVSQEGVERADGEGGGRGGEETIGEVQAGAGG
mmetsp:Transcript_29279/g.86709  ORF Transcript_29279/g.86709 Transcript_29279/m.86709 type:complete len:284 (-) Transcript_29279:425-1276(-)